MGMAGEETEGDERLGNWWTCLHANALVFLQMSFQSTTVMVMRLSRESLAAGIFPPKQMEKQNMREGKSVGAFLRGMFYAMWISKTMYSQYAFTTQP